MRHGHKVNHLGRTASHRKAMMANMASSLIKHKKIITTVAKAKALRVFVEPLITKSKDTTTHNYRTVFSYLKDKEAVKELFTVISEKVATRPGGYTRILKTGNRAGDNAEMALIELVDFNEFFDGFSKSDKAASKKTRRGRSKATGNTTSAPTAKAKSEPVVAASVIEDVVVEEISNAEVVEVAAPEVVAETAAPVAEETAAVEVAETSTTGDDLTAIDGVGPAFAERLNALGIFTFADLVALTDEKIAELEEKDSMTSLEEWHNWMDQAKGLMN